MTSPENPSRTTDNEILDYVDSQDRVLGKRTRLEIHQQQLLHRAVHIVIFSPEGNVLLQQRALSKDSHPGCWDSAVAGHVDSGESYISCAIREIREELGIVVCETDLTLCFKLPAQPATGLEFCQTYRLEYPGPFQPDSAEVASIDWYTPGQLRQWIHNGGHNLTPAFALIWQTLQSTAT